MPLAIDIQIETLTLQENIQVKMFQYKSRVERDELENV